ncbi:MAG: dethiobiotin synthase [Candidatus Omnitrophota bacterium]
MQKCKPIFITATDTNVGKTIATCVLGVLLKKQGLSVGVMKPVQCAGDDAEFLKMALELKDDLSIINPIFAPEPLSPHLALRRARIKFDLKKVKESLEELSRRHDVLLIEGAGGLMVPLTEKYYNADLIRDLGAEVIIVARLGLGTINHTLLTINQARAYGLKIKGIIFSEASSKARSLSEQSNPGEIEMLSKVKVLGIIPYLKPITTKNILRRCEKIKLPI